MKENGSSLIKTLFGSYMHHSLSISFLFLFNSCSEAEKIVKRGVNFREERRASL